jgi:GMP synthase-like glutamine amidotransferase
VGEVHLTAAAVGDAVFGAAPSPLPCVHWHGDTFSLPPGAVHLAMRTRTRPSVWGHAPTACNSTSR